MTAHELMLKLSAIVATHGPDVEIKFQGFELWSVDEVEYVEQPSESRSPYILLS